MSFASPRPILAEPAWPIPSRPPAGVNAGGIAQGRQTGRALAQALVAFAAPGLRLLPAAGFAWSGPRGLPRTRSDHALIWLTEGSATLRLPRTERPAPALLFMPAGTAFALESPPEANGTVLLLSRDLAERAIRPFPAAVVEAAPDAADARAFHSALAALAAEALRHHPGAQSRLEERLGQVALQLSRLAAKYAQAVPRRDPLVDRFLTLAARELPRGRSLEEVAAMLGCPAAALDRACMAQHGKPALDLFAALRIGRAVDLLAGTDRPLAEIARETGFTGRADLSRAVLAATGTLPEALRPR